MKTKTILPVTIAFAVPVLSYFYVIKGVQGAGNLLYFILTGLWLLSCLCVFTTCVADDLKMPQSSIPKPINLLSRWLTLVTICLLGWCGFITLTILYIWFMVNMKLTLGIIELRLEKETEK